MTFMINIGKYGGFYILNKTSFRVCLGWIAFTFIPFDIDDFIKSLTDKIAKIEKAGINA